MRARSLRAIDVAVALLAVVDVVLLALALRMGSNEVRDGAGRVTTGTNVALSLGVTLAVVVAIQLLPLSAHLRRMLQVFALASIAAHATGHIARLYYDFWWFDDLLHTSIDGFAAFLAVRVVQAIGLFPSRHATPARAALLALVTALALAGTWEIFEFSMDQIQGTREQDDLVDTMQDMIDGLVGGVAAAAWCWRHPRPDVEPRRKRL